MGKITKLTQSEGGGKTTAYPITIPQAIVDPDSMKTLREELDSLSKGTGVPLVESVAEFETLGLPIGQIGLVNEPSTVYSGGLGMLGMAKWDGTRVTDANGAISIEQILGGKDFPSSIVTLMLTFANSKGTVQYVEFDGTSDTVTKEVYSEGTFVTNGTMYSGGVWEWIGLTGYYLVGASNGATAITADNWSDTSADTINGWLNNFLVVSGGSVGSTVLYQQQAEGAVKLPISALSNNVGYTEYATYVFNELYDGMPMSASEWEKARNAKVIIVNGSPAYGIHSTETSLSFMTKEILPDDTFTMADAIAWKKYSLTYDEANAMLFAYIDVPVITHIADRPTLLNKADKVQVLSVTQSTMTIEPNKFYKWSSAMSALTITLGSAESGVLNEYMFQFTASSSGCTLTLPSGIKWLNGETPVIEGGKTYQVSIVNNLAVCGVFE